MQQCKVVLLYQLIMIELYYVINVYKYKYTYI